MGNRGHRPLGCTVRGSGTFELRIAAAFPTCPPPVLATAIPHVITGQTVGAGHFNMLEVPDQVNAMIEQFLRHNVS
ncbi:MAG: alpha/beta fold hydrolase [Acidimicrobiales bacterium]